MSEARNVPDVTFHYTDRVTRVEVDASLLAATRLGICLLQLPPSVPAIDGDHSRPLAISTVRDLLIGGPDHAAPALQRMIPGADPVLVVAPEYAFGSGDWSEIDTSTLR